MGAQTQELLYWKRRALELQQEKELRETAKALFSDRFDMF